MAKLLTKAIETKLVNNFNSEEENFKPALKLFGGSSCTWLITEYDKENNLFFGLCDLGMQSPELGWVSREELENARFQFGLGIERDMYFTADKTISEYAKEARELSYIKS